MTEKRYTALLAATVVAIPALAAANVYVQMNVPAPASLFSRTVHPASPSEITVHDKKIDLDAGENPFRQLETSNPDRVPQARRERAPGLLSELRLLPRRQHGRQRHVRARAGPDPDQLPRPGTIPMLRETFLFWRISKGGPGLPEEGGPWDTAMPAWEKFLKEDEIWDAILFLYDFTGQRPRAREEAGTK